MIEALASGVRWDGGAVWSERDGHLQPISRWAPGSDELALIMTAKRFTIGEGLPGAVYRSGEAQWIETVERSTEFTRQAEAGQAGVRSAFAFPVIVAGRTEAVIEMYSRARLPPEPELLAILQAAGLEIGRYLERAQARRHLVEMAEALQSSLLPPGPPTIPGLDIAVRYRAAAGEGQIGGDFFDVFPLPDDEWAISIGDVSGRGPRAAALTALARYTMRAAAIGASSPSAVLGFLNTAVRQELDNAYEGDERFLTAAYMTVAPTEAGFRVRLACGGHPLPLNRRANGTVEAVPCTGDLIGAFDTHESTDEEVVLDAGDLVVLVTDGVLEAGSGGEEFGEDRLKSLIAAAKPATASELADAIERSVLDFLGERSQDDIAIVILRRPDISTPSAAVEIRLGETE